MMWIATAVDILAFDIAEKSERILSQSLWKQ